VKVLAARPKGKPKRQLAAGTAGGRPTATKAAPAKPALQQQAPAVQRTPVRTAGNPVAARAAAAAATTMGPADANDSEYTSYTVDDDSEYTDAEESEEEEQKTEDPVVKVECDPATSQAQVVRTGAGGQAAAAKKSR